MGVHDPPAPTLLERTGPGDSESPIPQPRNIRRPRGDHALRSPPTPALSEAGLFPSRGEAVTAARRASGSRAVERLQEVRARGRGSAADFSLLFDALRACARPRAPLEREVARTPDLHVSFQSDAGETLACARIRRGRWADGPHAEPAATRVILTPATARRVLTGHPAGVLGQAYFDGRARVEGDVRMFMGLLNLLEALATHIDREFTSVPPSTPLSGRG